MKAKVVAISGLIVIATLGLGCISHAASKGDGGEELTPQKLGTILFSCAAEWASKDLQKGGRLEDFGADKVDIQELTIHIDVCRFECCFIKGGTGRQSPCSFRSYEGCFRNSMEA